MPCYYGLLGAFLSACSLNASGKLCTGFAGMTLLALFFPAIPTIIADTADIRRPENRPSFIEHRSALKLRIRTARLRAAVAVNEGLILLYWAIGRDILERQEVSGWGAKIVDRLSVDLKRDFPEMTGFSPRTLKFMRALAEAFPDRKSPTPDRQTAGTIR